tara:strand:- start:253 stop:525 length:273 start_codon:yes stop_codon:yes gene_type:complete
MAKIECRFLSFQKFVNCFQEKMDRGVQWLEVAMCDQTSFGVPDVDSEKSYRELERCRFLVKPCVKMAQKIPTLFCRFSSKLVVKDVEFDL